MDWRDWNAPRNVRSRELDFGLVCEALVTRKWVLIVPPLVALILFGIFLALQPARYGAEAANYDWPAGHRFNRLSIESSTCCKARPALPPRAARRS